MAKRPISRLLTPYCEVCSLILLSFTSESLLDKGK